MESLSYSNHHMMNFQFLSVCHYITSFGKIFYNLDLITQENQNDSVSVLNTLFEYINNSENESETKLQLIRKALNGSDLYGGGENETLDMKYVDETYQYIISSALFSHYGNIDGYLASIINQADNITYSALKENVFYQLSQNYISNDYCSPSHVNYQLTNLTIKKVFNEHVWSMFPEPEQNMKIMDINYIYAMIGLKIIRSIQGDTKNLTFENYILLAKLIEFQIESNETFQVAVKLFATPALFFYAFGQKGKLDAGAILYRNEKFLQMIIIRFINFLNACHGRILFNELKNSLFDKLNKVFTTFENTDVAEYRNTFSNEMLDFLREVEFNSLEQLLVDGNIKEKIKLNVTLKLLYIFHQSVNCRECIPGTSGKYGGIFIVFSIIRNGKLDFYVLRQDNNTLTLLSNISNKQILNSAAWNDVYSGEGYQDYYKDLHQSYHNYTMFMKVIAKVVGIIQANILLHSENIISKEEALEKAKSFPPFYTCLEGIKSDNYTESVICKPVFKNLLLIPEVGDNILSTVWKSKYTETGQQSLGNISKSKINYLTILFHVNDIYIKTMSNFFISIDRRKFIIDSRQILKPGFELSLQISNSCSKMLRGIKQALDSSFSSYPNVKNLLSTMKFAIYLLDKHAALNHNQRGLIFRYLYPGGSNYFGPLCISSFGRIAEFRTVIKIQYKVPVIHNPLPTLTDLQSCAFDCNSNCPDQATELSLLIDDNYLNRQTDNQSSNDNYYNLYNPKTGEIYEIIFRMQDNNILRLLGQYSDEDFLKIIDLSTFYAN
ncbi:uncharacterized protein LOC122512500 isoform X2 [Leptopilina heterotoma]|uniref:uncharacterized protein LOC122512500 isoform X2 n=1 Tax=Leptopilina heterotoma TaxID=63436 RepID=UPI001CA86EC2|nr:uncharacterized protein LOC122512500 isoform X2 [Leptopilina heterotoma]